MQLAVTSAGNGRPLLFIHGCPTPPDVLGAFADVVARACRSIQVALPGYGESAQLAGSWTVDDVQAAIEATVAPLLEERPLTIVGFSGGAYHALALATRGRLNVQQVVCLGGPPKLTRAVRDGFHTLAAALRGGQDLRAAVAARFLSPSFAAAHPEARRAVAAWPDAITREYLAKEFDAFAAAPDLHAEVGALEIPVLVRVGELDVAVDPQTGVDLVAATRHGTLEIVPGAGHALMFEDFEGTSASLMRVLA